MTCQEDSTFPPKPPLLSALPEPLLESVLEQLVLGGFAALPDAMRILMNAAMRFGRRREGQTICISPP
jgi:hypothetical protein